MLHGTILKKSILIYDDAEILFLCKAVLQKQNYDVHTLSNCKDVIADIVQIKPDLVLMDLWIGDRGGEEAVRQIRNDESLKDTPILLFSANAEIKDIAIKVNAMGI